MGIFSNIILLHHMANVNNITHKLIKLDIHSDYMLLIKTKNWNNPFFLYISLLKLIQHKCVSNVAVNGAKSSGVLLVHLLCRCVFAVYQEQVWCWRVELPGLALGPVQNIKNNFIDE